MAKVALGVILGLAVGAGSRFFEIPAPAPPSLVGALLVVAMTVGYGLADRYLCQHTATTKELCGGPSGLSASQQQSSHKGKE